MNTRFELAGPLTELSSYPQWTQDMVGECDRVKQTVIDHEMWRMMRDGDLEHQPYIANFMIGIWPVIERFPGYMAQSLLKTQYGRSEGDDLARRWLVRNIRVEQNHAEYWLNWAEGSGVPREQVLHGSAPHGTRVLADWCEEISRRGSLAASIASVNYAVEGATGEWAKLVYDAPQYAGQFPAATRKATLRWLQLHAAYDDTHPWEALEIVCTLLGATPRPDEVAHVAECIKRTYTSMRLLGDHCIRPSRIADGDFAYGAAAA